MSDSDLSDAPSAPMPPDSELEKALRKQVRDALKTGDYSSITVSSMRKAAEEALGLDAGFYKKSEKWKEESKRIVHETFVRCFIDAAW
jgi:DEK C terminal domain